MSNKCPWCGEEDFDKVGLKHHLVAGCCPNFDDTPPPPAPTPTLGWVERVNEDSLRYMGLQTDNIIHPPKIL